MDIQKYCQRLKASIEGSGLALGEISEKTGISVRSLKDYTSGKRYPKIRKLVSITDVIHVSTDYLFFHEKNGSESNE